MRYTRVKQQIPWVSGGLGRFGRKTPNSIAHCPDASSYQKFQPARGFRDRCVRQEAEARQSLNL